MAPRLSDDDTRALGHFQVKDHNNVYAIGNSAGVVSFYSQQSRAFHLAVTLDKLFDDEQKKTLEIAVLGGGVAGVTIWMALHVLGFAKSRLFEAATHLLSRQSESTHRFAHPSINEWPNVGSDSRPFRSTTSWPFANWHASSASSVIAQIRSDFLLTRLTIEKEALIHRNHIVKRIVDSSEYRLPSVTLDGELGSPLVGIDYRAALEGDGAMNFHVIVSAVGYCYEDQLASSDSKSYWWPDYLGNYKRDAHEYGNHTRIVSGTGDGGLIDCVRLSEAHRMQSGTKNKNLALEIAAFARPPEFKTLDKPFPVGAEGKISGLEKKLRKYFSEKDRTTSKPLTVGFNPSAREKALQAEVSFRTTLQGEFNDLFSDRKFSENFSSGDSLKYVKLAARSGKVFSHTASVANQILIAFLWSRQHDLVLCGTSVSNRKLENCPSHQKKSIDLAKCVFVLRHGANAKLAELLGIAKVETVEPSGRDTTIFESSMQLEKLRAKTKLLVGFAHLNLTERQIRDFFHEYFVDSTVIFEEMDGEKIGVRLALPNSDINDSVYRELGGYDPVVFGLPVAYEKGALDDFEFGSVE